MQSYTAVTSHFNSLYMNKIHKSSFASHNLAHHAEPAPSPPEFDRPGGPFDAYLMPIPMEQGEPAAKEPLPWLLRLLEG